MPRFVFFLFIFFSVNAKVFSQAENPNILFIYVDDLNDYVQGFGGHPQAQTPAMQFLTDNGTVFLNAHASSPKCMPSRTSTITGKDPFYTDVYRNKACKPLHDYVDGELFVLPEFMKDSAGYFTFGTGKILHCFDTYPEYDDITADACAKNLSWNKYVMFPEGENPEITDVGDATNLGLKGMKWAMIADTLEKSMWDYQSTDSLIAFIDKVGNGENVACEKPLFMMLGYHKPHQTLYIPQKYFADDFVADFYADIFNRPYNFPTGSYPYNGVVMPPQPKSIYQDYYNLPNDSLGQYFAAFDNFYKEFDDAVNAMKPLPEIEDLDDNSVKEILNTSLRANFVLAYLAAIRFIDTQIMRLLQTLQQYPDIYNNTIIILISDHGYALGEKRHWQKGTMWETDMRVPMVIADMRNPKQQTVTSMVSLLDLFPTICDLTEQQYPLFADGSRYLDGHSLLPLMEHPEKHIEEIALGSYTQQPDQGQASCFPAYSVRSSRFHFIQYTSNNTGWELDCNADLAWHEEELYEIGTDKNADANEWNNLIRNTDYLPVVNYMKQWLPSGKLYMQRTITAQILTDNASCFVNSGDSVQLSVLLFDTLGNNLSSAEGYVYRWTNNYNTDTVMGSAMTFFAGEVNTDLYNSTDRVMYYFELVDTVKNAVIAFDLKYIFINADNTPTISFTLNPDNYLQAEVENIEIEGSYAAVHWDYGDGNMFTTENPGPYRYAQQGDYIITATLDYGNACTVSYSQMYQAVLPQSIASADWIIFPNPAHDRIFVFDPDQSDAATLRISTLDGKIIDIDYSVGAGGFYSLDVHNLNPGLYFLTFNNGKDISSKPFIILH